MVRTLKLGGTPGGPEYLGKGCIRILCHERCPMVPTMSKGKKIAEQPHLSKISAAERGKTSKSWRVLPMGAYHSTWKAW